MQQSHGIAIFAALSAVLIVAARRRRRSSEPPSPPATKTASAPPPINLSLIAKQSTAEELLSICRLRYMVYVGELKRSNYSYVDNIRDALIEHDPDHANAYRDNAAAYKKQIRDTIAPLRDRIARIPEPQRWLVSCEGAFSYLARDFGMKELYLWPINAERTGTPQQVRKVVDGVKQHAIPAVFCESTVNTSPARQVARDTGARYGGVLYVDSLSEANGPVPTYLDLLRVDAQTIADGLHGRRE